MLLLQNNCSYCYCTYYYGCSTNTRCVCIRVCMITSVCVHSAYVLAVIISLRPSLPPSPQPPTPFLAATTFSVSSSSLYCTCCAASTKSKSLCQTLQRLESLDHSFNPRQGPVRDHSTCVSQSRILPISINHLTCTPCSGT